MTSLHEIYLQDLKDHPDVSPKVFVTFPVDTGVHNERHITLAYIGENTTKKAFDDLQVMMAMIKFQLVARAMVVKVTGHALFRADGSDLRLAPEQMSDMSIRIEGDLPVLLVDIPDPYKQVICTYCRQHAQIHGDAAEPTFHITLNDSPPDSELQTPVGTEYVMKQIDVTRSHAPGPFFSVELPHKILPMFSFI
jgi:hypothetical protein